MQMKLRTLLATAVTTLVLAVPTFAQSVTFAQFQQGISGNQFTFTNDSTSPNNLTLTASLPVTFKYLTTNGYGPANTDIAATMTLTAVATTPSTTFAGSTFQPFSSVTMTFTAVTPVGGQSDLLTVESSSTGTLNGQTLSQSAGLGGDNLGGLPGGDTVVFDSDFITIPSGATSDRNYSLSFTSLTPDFQPSVGNGNETAGYPVSFTAAGTGTFAFSTGVPEPSPVFALVIGAGLILLCVRVSKSRRPLNA